MSRREAVVDAGFEKVALPHTRSLLLFALRLTRDASAAEDLVQETMLSGWRGFHQFEVGSNARAWLFRILINAFHTANRKTGKSVTLLSLTPDLPALTDSTSELLEVTQALDRLPTDQRAALLLAVVEGFTCSEISTILGVPIGTVMSRLSRAREAMRKVLSPQLQSPREKVMR